MARKPSPVPPRAAAAILAAAALVAFVALALGDLLTASPTSDETAHLVAGYSYLVTHDYRLNPEHPPLAKMFAALPLLGMRVWPLRFSDAADGTLVTTDVPVALAFAATLYAFWRFAQRMTIARGATFAIAFGLAQTVKFSAVLLAPIVVLVAIWSTLIRRFAAPSPADAGEG